MASLVDIGEYDIDEDTLRAGIETYLDHEQSDERQGKDIQSNIREMSAWIEKEGIDRGTVVSYVEKLRKKIGDGYHLPAEGELEGWERKAMESPEDVSDDLNELYDGEGVLSDRVDDFRRSWDVDSSTIGVLLAAYDPDEYVLYNDEDFRVFTTYFTGLNGPSFDELSVGDRYQLFREYCSVLRTEISDERGSQVSLAEAQDFINTIAHTSECRYNLVLRYFFRYSQRMGRFEEQPSELLDEIRDLPDSFLREQYDAYEGRSKIAKIRYDILDAVLDGEEVDIPQIAQRENEQYEDSNIMHSWDEFKILAQIYYNYSKDRIETYLEDLTNYLAERIGGDDLSSHIVTYQGATNIPTTETWTVLYPSIFDSHRQAYQLYISFTPNEIDFGLAHGSEVPPIEYDFESFESEEEISVQEIVRAYEEREDMFWRLTGELTDKSDGGDYDEMDWFDDVANHLRRKKQIIFHGPPGTGKTYGALNFAKWWIDSDTDDDQKLSEAVDDRLRMVTFHPTFSYEDFIEGITAKTEEGNLVYEPKDGVFKEMCKQAREAYENTDSKANKPRYILIIDEVNRGNIPKIFGETITLIEDDKRLDGDNEMADDLPHSDGKLVVPPNLYVIGTMNTADRSIALVDSAIRRRFRFKNFTPDYETLHDELGYDNQQEVRDAASAEQGQELGALSILALEEINDRIRESGNLGKGKQVGHSYLIEGGIDERLVEAWKNEILPLLEEYYFGDMNRLQEHIFDGGGDELFDWGTKEIREDFGTEELQKALSDLVNLEEVG